MKLEQEIKLVSEGNSRIYEDRAEHSTINKDDRI